MPMEIKFEVKKGKDNVKYRLEKDIREYTEKELRKICGRYRDMANKRIKRLEAEKLPSPALHSVMKSGGKFSTKGKNLNQLRKETQRCINFLNMATSSVGGARAEKRKIEKRLGVSNLSEKQLKVIYQAFRDLRRANPGGLQTYGSDKLIQYIADEITSEDNNIDIESVSPKDWEKMISKFTKHMLEQYEKEEAELFKGFNNGGFSF